MSTGITDASEINKRTPQEPEQVELNLILLLKLSRYHPITKQSKTANAYRNKEAANDDGSSDEEQVHELASIYSNTRMNVTEGFPEPKQTIEIEINEKNLGKKSGELSEFSKIKKRVDQFAYEERYKKIYLHVIVPTDHEASISSAYTLVKNFDQDFVQKYNKIDSDKSDVQLVYFAGNSSLGTGSDDPNSEKPSNNDAKIAAVMSHYVYFYLDWLEYIHYHNDGIKEYQKSKVDISKEFAPYINRVDMKGEGLFSDGMAAGSEHTSAQTKIKLRIVNRLKEIYKAAHCKKDLYSILKLVLEKCHEIGRPVEFYELYDAFDYWEQDGKIIQTEACKWFVSHPSIVAENVFKGSSYKRILFFKKQKNEVFNIYADPITKLPFVFNSVLKHGMSGVSGYGGLLFAKLKDPKLIEGNVVEKFAYCNKGTDVNSLNDWLLVDVLQGLTGFSLQHVHAVKNAITIDKKVRKLNAKVPLFYCGHSLGGGLASSCAIVAKKRHAITFNAAGLNFLGSLTTRIVGAVSNLNIGALHPFAIAKRVHPIRIKGEAIDELMKLAKVLTMGLNERAYGSDPLVLDFHDSFLSETADKHGINNFLYKSVMEAIKIVDKSTTLHSANSSGEIKSISLNDINIGEVFFMPSEVIKLKKFAKDASVFKNQFQVECRS